MKLLIVRLSSIGDVIQGIPCLVALKESFPDWKISWLVEETSEAVLRGHPHLDQLFVLKRKWRTRTGGESRKDGVRNFLQTWQAIRGEHFDAAIDLQGLFKSGLWTWLSHAPRRIGHNRTREFAHAFLNEYVSDRPMFDPRYPLIDRYLEPAKTLGADLSKARYVLPPTSKTTVAEVDALLQSPDRNPQWIAFCPWSAWKSKNWPADFWKELLESLREEHRILLIGSSAESPHIPKLMEREHPHVKNLVGQTTLPTLMEIFRRCRLVVGPDTGPMHLANATGVPKILMLFGSTSWRRSGPYGSGHASLSLDLDCQPCFQRICPLEHQNCLKQLGPKTVLQKIRELLAIQRKPEVLSGCE